MKRKILFVSLAVISFIFIIIYLKVNVIDRKVPYTPIDLKNVDKVAITGFSNKTSTEIDIRNIVESINKIKIYQKINIPVNHSTPSPNWTIIVTMKDKQSIIVYEDYDGITKISDWHKSYIIDKTIAQQVLKENNLQKRVP